MKWPSSNTYTYESDDEVEDENGEDDKDEVELWMKNGMKDDSRTVACGCKKQWSRRCNYIEEKTLQPGALGFKLSLSNLNSHTATASTYLPASTDNAVTPSDTVWC